MKMASLYCVDFFDFDFDVFSKDTLAYGQEELEVKLLTLWFMDDLSTN